MTFETNSFNHFHLLPEENPIEISSDESDAGDDSAGRTIIAQQEQFQPRSEEPEKSVISRAASAAFRAAIGNSIPFLFIETDLRKSIQISGNRILDIATALGVNLDAVSIDSNCLPSWPDRAWDPEVQSLHQTIQSRLMERQNAEELGPTMRNTIVKLGNERIEEALQLGLELRHLAIGDDLLPTWPDRDHACESEADNFNCSDDITIMDVDESVHSDDSTLHGTRAAVVDQLEVEAGADIRPQSAWNSETESDDDCESDPEPESDYDDEISLFNFVSQQPVVIEPEDNDDDEEEEVPLRNIIHDVDVFGASFNGLPVDFEVYLAQNDPDAEQLPEVEMAIEEEGFEHHHHLADAVDIELADSAIYWTVTHEGGEEEEEQHVEAPGLEDVPEYTTESTLGGSSMEPATPNSGGIETEAEVPAGWIMI
ncbi:hypothetical protein PWT90_10207 [Aphanocladium album]|nr:hypothetical protein PWT90_10207 [Aphanocladium album]